MIYEERASRARRDSRKKPDHLLGFIGAGDTLMVTCINCLVRSMKELQDIAHELQAKGAALKATEQPVDTGSARGRA